MSSIPILGVLVLLVTGCASSSSDSRYALEQDPVKAFGLNDCDVDIRPLTRKGEKLHIAYEAKASEMKVVIDSPDITKAVTLHIGSNGTFVDHGKLEPGKPRTITIQWKGKTDKADVDSVAKKTLDLTTEGPLFESERTSSPRLEMQEKGEWVRIRCQNQGRAVVLMIK